MPVQARVFLLQAVAGDSTLSADVRARRVGNNPLPSGKIPATQQMQFPYRKGDFCARNQQSYARRCPRSISTSTIGSRSARGRRANPKAPKIRWAYRGASRSIVRQRT
jgi:hypothetical protein